MKIGRELFELSCSQNHKQTNKQNHKQTNKLNHRLTRVKQYISPKQNLGRGKNKKYIAELQQITLYAIKNFCEHIYL